MPAQHLCAFVAGTIDGAFGAVLYVDAVCYVVNLGNDRGQNAAAIDKQGDYNEQ